MQPMVALPEPLHTAMWDGIASLAIGVLLAGVALMLGAQPRRLLLGAAASSETVLGIEATLAEFPEVVHVVRLITMQMGSHSSSAKRMGVQLVAPSLL